MTAGTVAPSLGHTLDISSTRPVSFWRLVRVELRKSYDTRAGMWLLLTMVLLSLAVEGIVLAVTTVQDEAMNSGDFVGAAAFVTSVLLPILGIMLVTSEWGQRTAMVTFALEPRRPRVILAKLVTGLVLTLATASSRSRSGLSATCCTPRSRASRRRGSSASTSSSAS